MIKFIPWMVGKCPAKQWRMFKNNTKETHGLMYIPKEEETMYSSEYYKDGSGFKYGITVYHILLGKAIEGINKESYFGNGQIEIVYRRWGIQILDYSTDDNIKESIRFESEGVKSYSTVKAKEAALKYIYEQEKGK